MSASVETKPTFIYYSICKYEIIVLIVLIVLQMAEKIVYATRVVSIVLHPEMRNILLIAEHIFCYLFMKLKRNSVSSDTKNQT